MHQYMLIAKKGEGTFSEVLKVTLGQLGSIAQKRQLRCHQVHEVAIHQFGAGLTTQGNSGLEKTVPPHPHRKTH